MATSGSTRTTLISPFQYFADPTRARPIFNGFIFIGRVDGDPTNTADQIPVQVIRESGGPVTVAQPIRTGPGGLPIYNGSPAQIVVCRSNYSLTLQNNNRVQVYHSPNVQSGIVNQPITHTTLAAAMADDNSSRQVIKLLERGGAEFRRAVDLAEYNNYPEGARFTDSASNMFVSIVRSRTNADTLGLQGGVDESQETSDIEDLFSGLVVDLQERTVIVSAIPSNNKYVNGSFQIGSTVYPSENVDTVRSGHTNISLGQNSLQGVSTTTEERHGAGNVAIGDSALSSDGCEVRQNVAIGTRAMMNAEAQGTKWNVGIGLESLFELNGVSDNSNVGTRITAVGANSGRFMNGEANSVYGRNAGQCITSGTLNVALGANAMSGRGSLKFKNRNDIFNQTPFTNDYCTAIGHSAMFFGGGDSSTAVGRRALENAKSDATNCIAIGADCLLSLGSLTSQEGNVQVNTNTTGTYIMNATSIVFTMSGHSIQVGYRVIVRITSGVPDVGSTDAQYYTVTGVSGDTFTVSEPEGVTASGNFTLNSYSTTTAQESSGRNIGIGVGAMFGVSFGRNNVSIGANSSGANNNGSFNTAIGDVSLRHCVDGDNNTAIGQFALSRYINGNNATSLNNCTGVGRDSFISSDNQVQLGNSATTTFAYGAVQNRSDERDKADVRGIPDEFVDFVLAVDWKQFKWDYRDDYISVDDDGNVTKLDKDGSKKRNRYHNGVIAQQIGKLAESMGIDFSGYQDHSLSGGQDVLSVGYQEFIPLLGELCQRQQKRIDAIEKRLDSAGL